MTTAARATQRGISKLEFLTLVAVIGIVFAVLLERLVGLEEEAERTEVGLTERNMRVGLQLAVGEDLMRGREEHLAELLAANPVSFLGHLPRGYVGACDKAVGPGSWCFDPATHLLTYRPRLPEAFGGKTELHWTMTSQGALGGRMAGIRLENRSD